MPTAKKAAVIDELTEKLGRINAAALIEYRGLTVAEIGELRGQLRPSNVEVQVTKNTLLREAAHRNDMTDLDELFNGPTAVAFIYGDEASGTKALNDYFRTARVGAIKAGILKGGRGLTAEQFAKLADLPNRETLLAQIAGLLESPLSQLAALFNAPAQQFAYALAAFEDKGGAATGISAAAGSTASVSDEPALSESVAAPIEETTPAATAPAPLSTDTATAAPLGSATELTASTTATSLGSATELTASTTLAPVESVTDPIGATTPAPVESATAISSDATRTAPEPIVASTDAAPEPAVASTTAATFAPVESATAIASTPAPAMAEADVALVDAATSAPVEPTIDPVQLATEPTIDPVQLATEPTIDPVQLATETTGSATEPARPAVEAEPSTPVVSSATETAQRAAADPSSAPESEGSADAQP